MMIWYDSFDIDWRKNAQKKTSQFNQYKEKQKAKKWHASTCTCMCAKFDAHYCLRSIDSDFLMEYLSEQFAANTIIRKWARKKEKRGARHQKWIKARE